MRSHFITQQQRTLPAPTETRGYGYQDWQYYLTCGSGPWGGTACSPSPTGNPLQWTYDKIGNRATEVRAGLTDSYVYDDNSGATGDTAVLDVVNLGVMGTRDYTFDNGGYLTQISAGANVLDFSFDDAGELGSVVRGAQSLTNSYDGRGFLQSAADATSGGSVNATYSSSGLLHSLERLPATGGTLERHNVLYFAGRPIAIWKKVGVAAATTTYLVTDHLGTPTFALNQAGTEYWKGGLEPFGRDWQEGTANDMLTKGIFLRFPGQWDDGLFANATLGADCFYNLHRWYQPLAGAFASADPLGLGLGDHTLYSYVEQQPLSLSDPMGLFSVRLVPQDYDQIQRTCQRKGALGCTKPKFRVDCSCGCDGSGWAPSPRVGVTQPYPLYFASDCKDPEQIIKEEMRHLRVDQANFAVAQDDAASFGQRRFESKESCEFSCEIWKGRMFRNLLAGWTHDFIDWTHPWFRSCH